MKRLKLASKDLTILYAEDDIKAREEVSDILNLIFKKVLVAKDGQDALTQYQKEEGIDLILTDIKMPNITGIKLIETIREKNDEIPVIILSAHSEIDYFLNTIKLGIDGYILKPIDIAVLSAVLNNVVAKINLKKENEDYKVNLEKKVTKEIKKRQHQEKILFQQSKLAAMGEMIDAIAHQWKQPLHIMALQTDMLQYDYEDGYIDKDYIDEYSTKFKKQLNHTLSTLEEFRNFFRPNSVTKEFSVSDTIDSVLVLVKDEFLKNAITIRKEILSDIRIDGHENEFKHLILNIINNSKDALIETNTKDKLITIKVKKEENSSFLEIEDNAGGIPEYIIKDIFKPNITTKAEGKGTGIGLYMSLQIAKKIHGDLYVHNSSKGAKFIFEKPHE